jgi:thiol-disulfide isomerase/thioredoxin
MNAVQLRWAGGAALLLIAGAVYLFAGQLRHGNGAAGGMQISPAALYATQLSDLQGKPQPLGQWQGKLLVLNFWATWCAPCREEIPRLIEAQRKHAARGVQIVGIAVDSAEKAAAYSREMGIDYPLLVDESGGLALATRLGNRPSVLPFTALIDRQGRVSATVAGGVDQRRLEQMLQQALAERSPPSRP